ncbi:hypothetical protein C4565_00315 [Candidatus Parcubacteria bacterium]|nr:MAG: hypothetical protein C4565_00315 [Candidatus Parcubacteria bacterium]
MTEVLDNVAVETVEKIATVMESVVPAPVKISIEDFMPTPAPVVGHPFAQYWARNRKNSQPTRINKALSIDPQTPAQIAEKCGLSEDRVKEHLEYWTMKEHRTHNVGLILQVNDGKYFLKA